MRLHTDQCMDNLTAAAQWARVETVRFTHHKSRSRRQAFDIVLSGSNSRRINSPTLGHHLAATWDEWGIFLHYLFERDSTMIAGEQYRGQYDFNNRTGDRFGSLTPSMRHQQHIWRFFRAPAVFERDLSYGTQHCACGAIRRF